MPRATSPAPERTGQHDDGRLPLEISEMLAWLQSWTATAELLHWPWILVGVLAVFYGLKPFLRGIDARRGAEAVQDMNPRRRDVSGVLSHRD